MKLRETRAGKYDMRKIFKGQKKGVKYEITEQPEFAKRFVSWTI